LIRSEGRRLVMILHSGDYDRIHHGLSIALAAVANGMSCSIFVAYDAQSRLTKAQADKIPDDALFKRSLRKLIIEAKQAGSLKLYACGSSLNLMALPPFAARNMVLFPEPTRAPISSSPSSRVRAMMPPERGRGKASRHPRS